MTTPTDPLQKPITPSMARRIIKKLRLGNGYILAIKSNTQLAKHGSIEQFGEAIARMGYQNVLIVVTDNLEDINTWSPDQMHQHGWYHISQIGEAMRKSRDGK